MHRLLRFSEILLCGCIFALGCSIRLRMSDPAFEIDGRKGWQWTASAISYLQFRSGRAWRPARHRFHPEHEYFVRAINLLNQVESAIPEPCACVYCSGSPFYDAKKPVASVAIEKAKAARA